MRKIAIFATLGAVLSGGVAFAGPMPTVDQKGLSFSVPALTVNRGDTVTFTNSDTTSHNIVVTGEGVQLSSGLQAPGVPFHAPFLKPGTYHVGCAIHPRMKMTVTVK